MKGYNTNLASEYYILSMLYRKGFDAYITLGNKKTVDILVDAFSGTRITIDVKGIRGKTLFPLDNFHDEKIDSSLYIVFVSYLNEIHNHEVKPDVFIVPSLRIKEMLYINPKKTRKGVNYSTLFKEYNKEFKNAWYLLYGFVNPKVSPHKEDESKWIDFIRIYSEIKVLNFQGNDIEINGLSFENFAYLQQKYSPNFEIDIEKLVSQYCSYKTINQIISSHKKFKLNNSLDKYTKNFERIINERKTSGETPLTSKQMTVKFGEENPSLIKQISERKRLSKIEKRERKARKRK